MTQIVVSMVVIVLVAGVVTAYVAFPHRGEDLPGAPWLGRLMRKGARSLPTVEPEPGDVVPPGGEDDPAAESPCTPRPPAPARPASAPRPTRVRASTAPDPTPSVTQGTITDLEDGALRHCGGSGIETRSQLADWMGAWVSGCT